MADQIHLALMMLCKEEAAPSVKKVPEGAGLEAWRRLTTHFEPATNKGSRPTLTIPSGRGGEVREPHVGHRRRGVLREQV